MVNNMEIRQIKCPWCSAVLSIKYQAGMEHKSLTCPVCKRSSALAEYKPYIAPQEEHTCYPSIRNSESSSVDNSLVGHLFVPSSGKSYKLNVGKNIIGRNAAVTKATVKIETPANKRISREHLIISVSLIKGRGLIHALSLYKERLNHTSVNGVPLSFGDQVILKHGDIINLPDLDLVFQIPDPDLTEI